MSAKCVLLTPYVLCRLRALGPYTLLIYIELLKHSPAWSEQFSIKHATLVSDTATSYRTVRKALAVLEDLELVTITTRTGLNQHTDGFVIALHRRGCASSCTYTVCQRVVDNSVDNSTEGMSEYEVAVASNATATVKRRSRVAEKAQVGEVPWPEMPRQNNRGGEGGLYIEDIPVLSGKGKGMGKGREKLNPWADDIFAHWNEAGITVHKVLMPSTRLVLYRVLENLVVGRGKDEAADEIKAAITNYATCLHDEQYAWSHKWTLEEFLRRGLARFMDEAEPLERERQLAVSSGKKKRPAHDFKAKRAGAFADL